MCHLFCSFTDVASKKVIVDHLKYLIESLMISTVILQFVVEMIQSKQSVFCTTPQRNLTDKSGRQTEILSVQAFATLKKNT